MLRCMTISNREEARSKVLRAVRMTLGHYARDARSEPVLAGEAVDLISLVDRWASEVEKSPSASSDSKNDKEAA